VVAAVDSLSDRRHAAERAPLVTFETLAIGLAMVDVSSQ
jgi:hypothetical protein